MSAIPSVRRAVRAPRHAAGVTLLELLVTVVIVAIAAAVGLPKLSQLVDDAAVASQADTLLQSLSFTRAEAVKRNARVTMCRSSDGSSCAAAAASGQWRDGWIVFVDGGDAAVREAGDELLRVQAPLGASGQILGGGNVSDYVSYMSNGQTRLADGGAQAGSFSVCARAAGARRRRITLTPGSGWAALLTLAPAAICDAA